MNAIKDKGRGERMSADMRRAFVLDAAVAEFGTRGLFGARTEEIAAEAGISHSYLFKLFGTKKELFLAVTARAYEYLELLLREGAEARPDDPLRGMEERMNAFVQRRGELLIVLQGFAAAAEPDVAMAVRGWWDYIGCRAVELSGVDDERTETFFARVLMIAVGSALYPDKVNNG